MQMYDVDSETPVIMKPVSPVSLNSSSTPEQSSNRDITPIRAKAQHLMIQYHDYTHHNPRATVVSPTSPLDGHHYLDCPKVWERIVSHPRFDEVDIEQLCAELNARIKIVLASLRKCMSWPSLSPFLLGYGKRWPFCL